MGRKTITIPDEVIKEIDKINKPESFYRKNLSDICADAIRKYIEEVRVKQKGKNMEKY